MRSDVQCDRKLQNSSAFADLYYRQQQRQNSDEFVLHDGPPYANGDPHLGHAINKIAKDIICRYKVRQGMKVEMIPGWDCHGLPIELKASLYGDASPISIRQKASQFSKEAVENQRKSFKKWGIMADWRHPYITSDKEYVSKELEAFYILFEKDLIFKGHRPVYWSPSNKTTLAEAELEYKDHDGYSVFVKFDITNMPREITDKSVSALIWTTTPWTLLSNQAITYNERKSYVVVRCEKSGEQFLIASDLINSMESSLNTTLTVISQVESSLLSCLKYSHPLKPNEEFPFIDDVNVIMSKGTGLVHCAPNHGHEDYCAAIRHGINLGKCFVNEEGFFTQEAGFLLQGKPVLTEGSEKILEMLKSNIVYKSKYCHSYPHDWRSQKPVITIPTSQWFIDIESIRKECIETLEKIDFNPPNAKEELKNQLLMRSSWCISRQRSWGVPIPAFYLPDDKQKLNPILSKELINHICELIRKKGSNVWWMLSKSELTPHSLQKKLSSAINVNDLIKEKDILDVWFDSGLSWNNVLKGSKIADIYLEGIDQVRGWFQSSLILSVALRHHAPYKTVLLHGFALDENGRKMSKSLGNVIDPNEIVEKHGADFLRWWVARNFSNNQILWKNTISQTKSFDKVRQTLRFCIGCLNGFNASHCLNLHQMSLLDQYMLYLLHGFSEDIQSLYSKNDFKNIVESSMNFITEDVSAFYFEIAKDRLYCDKEDSKRRKSCQTVLYLIYHFLIQYLSPIVPHLSQESFENTAESQYYSFKSVFELPWFSCPQEWQQEKVFNYVSIVRSIAEAIVREVKTFRSSSVAIHIESDEQNVLEALSKFQPSHSSSNSELVNILRVSSVNYGEDCVDESDAVNVFYVTPPTLQTQIKIIARPGNWLVCHRCRRFTAENEEHLCSRCIDVLSKFAV